MKGAIVYHKIQSLRQKYSQRAIAKRLGISVNTVRKYEHMSLEEAAEYLSGVNRRSQFDIARDLIEKELGEFPKMSAVKLLRKIQVDYPDIGGKVRALRYYIKPIREAIISGDFRHYAPVLDMKPGVQVQVDIGEQQVQRDKDGNPFKVWFVSFVFSYCRYAFVTFRGRCYDTDSFIAAHQEAFAFFGGIAEEYVYDQTKLVVITERYREVFLNEKFHQFATKYGFRVRVCEGYDPESKGKVERFISYVKSDFLYGDYFTDIGSVKNHSETWLKEIANARIHSVTGRQPAEMFKEEKPHLSAFETPDEFAEYRWADKMGLISYKGNKYSVPHPYQRQQLKVACQAGYLLIYDPEDKREIARHEYSTERGRIFKNNNHYRNYRKSVDELAAEALTLFDFLDDAAQLLKRIKTDNPHIARDQIRALIKLQRRFEKTVWQEAAETIFNLPVLRATVIESLLATYEERRQAEQIQATNADSPAAENSALDRPLAQYMEVLS